MIRVEEIHQGDELDIIGFVAELQKWQQDKNTNDLVFNVLEIVYDILRDYIC